MPIVLYYKNLKETAMFSHISSSITAVGVADTDLALFENQYPLTEGVTYNSYVVADGGTTAVIDAVDRRMGDEWLRNVEAACPGGVDYLVVQHMEPDHSATVADFMKRYPDAKIVTSAKASAMLGQFFPDVDFEGRIMVVGEGDELKVGSHTLKFLTAPMVHWPEVIVTLDTKEKTLFTADAFGTFGTCGDYDTLWPDEARRYYTNIVGKYGQQVQRLLAKLHAFGPLVSLCPLHGPVIERANIARSVELYSKWSAYTPELPDGVLVAYASIYGNTAAAARRLAAMLEEDGCKVVAVDLCAQDVSVAVAQAFRMGRIVLASPTYDGGLFPAMHSFLWHLSIKGLRQRRFGLMENGTWAPTAAHHMANMIAELKDCQVIPEKVTIHSALAAPDETALRTLARAIREG